jgi:hypothetical protein
MKALSLLQPWASLVVLGAKKIETRSWTTRHRGDLLIHASKGRSGALLCQEPPFTKYISDFNTLPFGAIIGKVYLQEVVPIGSLAFSDAYINALALEERAFGDYTPGRYAWLLCEPVIFDAPIFTGGALNLWEFDEARII